MNTETLRWLDRFVAGTACAILRPGVSLLRRVFRRRPRDPKKILVVKFFGLGSLLRAVPMLAALRARYPAASIDLMTFAPNEAFLRRFGLVTRFRGVDPSSVVRLARSLLGQAAAITGAGYDAVIDMEFFSNFTSLLSLLTRAPVRVGFYQRRSFRESLYNRVVFYNASRHVEEVYLALAREVDAPASSPVPALAIAPEEREAAARLLAEFGVPDGAPLAVVHANSSDVSLERRWTPEGFAEVARALVAGGAAVVFTGAPSEREHVASIVSRCPGAFNAAGRTDVGTMAALIARARVLVGNDGGPPHVADLLGVPSVVLYGPESPAHYGVRGARHVVFSLGLYCSPCLNAANSKVAPCGGRNACMASLPAGPVARAARALLRGEEVPEEDRRRWNGFGGRFATHDWRSGVPGPIE